MADNAADEAQVKERGRQQKSKRQSELDDVYFILGTFQGRRFFWRYLSRCGIFETSFTGNNTTFFKEGERNIGLQMLADLNQSNPNAYAVMMKEAADDQIKKKFVKQNQTKKEEAIDG